MKRTLVVGIALGVLALADTAAAKGPFTIAICGSTGCASVRQEVELREPDALGNTLLAALHRGRLKAPTVSTPAPAPYLSLRIVEWEGSPTFYYVPSRRLLRMAPYWFQAPGGFVRLLRRAAVELRPWPTPQLSRVLLGSRRVPDPSRYTVLMGPLAPAPVPTDAGKSVKLTLEAKPTSPWTVVPLTCFPADRTLYRDSQWLQLPKGVDCAPADNAGLAPTRASTAGSGPLAWIVAGSLATLLLGAAAGATLRGRRARSAAGRAARPL